MTTGATIGAASDAAVRSQASHEQDGKTSEYHKPHFSTMPIGERNATASGAPAPLGISVIGGRACAIGRVSACTNVSCTSQAYVAARSSNSRIAAACNGANRAPFVTVV